MKIKKSISKVSTEIRQYPKEFCRINQAMIIESTNDKIIIGITSKTPEKLKKTLNLIHHGKNVEFKEISISEFQLLFSRFETTDLESDNSACIENIDSVEKDAPVINIVNSICFEAIEQNASDIHIEACENATRVRFRIDGKLKTAKIIQKSKFQQISSRIKVLANLNILESRQPQDGRITVSSNDRKIDLRVSILPTTNGESIVLRILGRKSDSILSLQNLNDLGFSEENLSKIKKIIDCPHGLFLITGPTGSGKTTTLNAILQYIKNDEDKIITIEDPVEVLVDGINQIQINDQIGLGFDTILRRVLRQDPNIILIGEIRDSETARLAVRAALTGHLVLSTLHTNDAVGTISRLENMGIEPYILADVLKGALAQRLIRKKNAQTNSTGRIVISEIFNTDDSLSELITSHAKETTIKAHLIKKGMKTISEDAMDKVNQGIISIEDLRKEIEI